MHQTVQEAISEWLREYDFTLFLTLTFQPVWKPMGEVQDWAKRKIDEHLRYVAKKKRITIASLGVIVLSHGNQLHAHVLLMKKGGGTFNSGERELLDRAWNDMARAIPVTTQDELTDYIGSHAKSHAYRDYKIFSYDKKLLNKSRKAKSHATA